MSSRKGGRSTAMKKKRREDTKRGSRAGNEEKGA